MLFLHVPPPIYKTLATWLSWRGWSAFGQTPAHPPVPVPSIQDEAHFPFHQPGLFNGIWVASSPSPLSVTVWKITGSFTVAWEVISVALRSNCSCISAATSSTPTTSSNCSCCCFNSHHHCDSILSQWPSEFQASPVVHYYPGCNLCLQMAQLILSLPH